MERLASALSILRRAIRRTPGPQYSNTPSLHSLSFAPMTGYFASEFSRLLMPNLLADWHGCVTEFARLLVYASNNALHCFLPSEGFRLLLQPRSQNPDVRHKPKRILQFGK